MYSNFLYFDPIPKKIKICSGSVLKTAAVATMLIDHAGAGLLYYMIMLSRLPFNLDVGSAFVIYRIMRLIGRCAFPIYCFLLVEGLLHSKNRLKYSLRLLAFALISEIPFDLALFAEKDFSDRINPYEILIHSRAKILSHQNVFFTLLTGLIVIWICDFFYNLAKNLLLERVQIKKDYSGKYTVPVYLAATLLSFSAIFAGCISAEIICCDYGYGGILLISVFYLLRKSKALAGISGYAYISWYNPSEIFALPGFILILLYNGERGFIKSNTAKYFFYAFYPAHLIIIYLIRSIIL